MGDKVKFGIKNAHIFPITAVNAGIPTYGSPIDVPGAVSFSLNAQGDINKFYADNVVYYQSASNNGYEGDLEVALIPDAVFEQIFKYNKDQNGVISENTNVEYASFAMTFEEAGDVTGTKFVLYNCTATRPTRTLNTIEESKTPTTQTLTVSAIPLASGDVLAMTTETTPSATINAWHSTVYMPSNTPNCLVQFNSNGGSAVQSQTVVVGGKATEPDAPTKEGYTFDAWYSDLGLTDEWTFSTDTVTTNMMLYAKWTEN
jgi:phi13 family phage major tail protein